MTPHFLTKILRNVATASFLCWGTAHLLAQSNTEFAISKIEPQIVTTPSVSFSSGSQKTTKPKSWMEVEVTFGWTPRSGVEKYADDVTMNYYVLLSDKSTTSPKGTLLTGQVTHGSIPAKQNDLKSVMYVSPRTLERFFDGKVPSSVSAAVVDIGVTISHQGQVVAEKSLKGSGAWWTQYQPTAGHLLNKSETPFAPLYGDYYEAVKKQ